MLLADFTMSLDNVLGVAGAAGSPLPFASIWVSFVYCFDGCCGESDFYDGLKKYKWIAWVGLIAILMVALDLIYTDIKLLT